MLVKKLPQPDPVAQLHSDRLKLKILEEIDRQGPLTFARYMNLALYSLGLGYYSAGAHKFGAAGDFVTAPEISPIFSQCVARQCYQILQDLNGGDILELGAGTGMMAVGILKELKRNRCLPNYYFILEVSADLRDRQKTFLRKELPELADSVRWLNQLPTNFVGIIVGNEVIDALPAHKFKIENNAIKEIYVDSEREEFVWKISDPSSLDLTQQIKNLGIDFPTDYESEINLLLTPWIASLADVLKKGLILLIDYGFPRHEYYHPNRNRGTIASHYRHYSHFDPLILPGIQDITIHVDFTAVAEAAARHRLSVAGFIHQAGFLLNCGLTSFTTSSKNVVEHYQIAQQIKKLTLPSEMGELFKVIALTRNYNSALLGFSSRNQIGRLSF
ncbi:class I SAM-dependent methyltransferase [Candidatus Coxiella mudrowiae]|uniref:class I SAM-dependent methyltransferase n=1 Tax=Candidatus Coxiella mudrowiae TaxID=2054173 RepID=UPI000C288A89|nr:SAM-dependent methyltransferase [Candidatus Coxiella mudrowiae]